MCGSHRTGERGAGTETAQHSWTRKETGVCSGKAPKGQERPDHGLCEGQVKEFLHILKCSSHPPMDVFKIPRGLSQKTLPPKCLSQLFQPNKFPPVSSTAHWSVFCLICPFLLCMVVIFTHATLPCVLRRVRDMSLFTSHATPTCQ